MNPGPKVVPYGLWSSEAIGFSFGLILAQACNPLVRLHAKCSLASPKLSVIGSSLLVLGLPPDLTGPLETGQGTCYFQQLLLQLTEFILIQLECIFLSLTVHFYHLGTIF